MFPRPLFHGLVKPLEIELVQIAHHGERTGPGQVGQAAQRMPDATGACGRLLYIGGAVTEEVGPLLADGGPSAETAFDPKQTYRCVMDSEDFLTLDLMAGISGKNPGIC